MATKQYVSDDLHAATSAEISRPIAEFTAKRRAATEEFIAIQKHGRKARR